MISRSTKLSWFTEVMVLRLAILRILIGAYALYYF